MAEAIGGLGDAGNERLEGDLGRCDKHQVEGAGDWIWQATMDDCGPLPRVRRAGGSKTGNCDDQHQQQFALIAETAVRTCWSMGLVAEPGLPIGADSMIGGADSEAWQGWPCRLRPRVATKTKSCPASLLGARQAGRHQPNYQSAKGAFLPNAG